VKDQEPDHEGDAVSRKIDRLGEDHFFDPVQPQGPRLITPELARPGQDQPDADRYGDERERLLEQVRPALAFPGPPADHVAHRGAGEPPGRAGLACADVQQLADEVGQLGSSQCQHGSGREADQAPAALTAHQLAQPPGDYPPDPVSHRRRGPDWRGAMHSRPRVIQAFGSVRHGIQYGTLRRPGKHPIPRESAAHCQLARGYPVAGKLMQDSAAGTTGAARPASGWLNPPLPSPGYKKTIVTDKAGARS
jgi:hypothetical protein